LLFISVDYRYQIVEAELIFREVNEAVENE